MNKIKERKNILPLSNLTAGKDQDSGNWLQIQIFFSKKDACFKPFDVTDQLKLVY